MEGFVTECTKATVKTMAMAGASSHGASATMRGAAASMSITPQLGVGGAKPRPAKDNVASAITKAGTSSVAWTPRKPRVAGSK